LSLQYVRGHSKFAFAPEPISMAGKQQIQPKQGKQGPGRMRSGSPGISSRVKSKDTQSACSHRTIRTMQPPSRSTLSAPEGLIVQPPNSPRLPGVRHTGLGCPAGLSPSTRSQFGSSSCLGHCSSPTPLGPGPIERFPVPNFTCARLPGRAEALCSNTRKALAP
jgi:hypothetical protein